MPVETFFLYGPDKYLVSNEEQIPALREAVSKAKDDDGGWVVFNTPDGQVSIYIEPNTEIKIIRKVRP